MSVEISGNRVLSSKGRDNFGTTTGFVDVTLFLGFLAFSRVGSGGFSFFLRAGGSSVFNLITCT